MKCINEIQNVPPLTCNKNKHAHETAEQRDPNLQLKNGSQSFQNFPSLWAIPQPPKKKQVKSTDPRGPKPKTALFQKLQLQYSS